MPRSIRKERFTKGKQRTETRCNEIDEICIKHTHTHRPSLFFLFCSLFNTLKCTFIRFNNKITSNIFLHWKSFPFHIENGFWWHRCCCFHSSHCWLFFYRFSMLRFTYYCLLAGIVCLYVCAFVYVSPDRSQLTFRTISIFYFYIIVEIARKNSFISSLKWWWQGKKKNNNNVCKRQTFFKSFFPAREMFLDSLAAFILQSVPGKHSIFQVEQQFSASTFFLFIILCSYLVDRFIYVCLFFSIFLYAV